MTETLFSYNFTHWEAILLALIPGLISFGLFIYILFRLPKTTTSYIFAAFVLACATWQMGDTFIRMSDDAYTAIFWDVVLNIGIISTVAFGIHFALIFIEKFKWADSIFVRTAIYLPAIFFISCILWGVSGHNIVYSSFWGWISTPGNNTLENLQVAYASLFGLITLFLLSINAWRLRKKGGIVRKRAMLIAIGYVIPAAQGIITQAIMPYLFGVDEVPLTSTFIVAFSIAVVIALKKFDLFVFDPRHVVKQIVKTMNDGIMVVDNNQIIKYANDKFLEIVGYKDNELIDINMSEILQDNDINLMIPTIKKEEVLSQPLELRIRKRSGTYADVLMSASPYKNSRGMIIGSMGIFSDITEIKRAEIIKKESEEFNRILFQQSTEAIYTFDPKTKKVINYNPSFLKYLKYTKTDAIQLYAYDFIKDTKKNIDKKAEKILRSGEVDLGERTWICKDSKLLTVNITAKKVIDKGKDVILIEARDFTEYNKAKELLKQKNTELESFIYKASHDIKGPLSSCMGLVNIATSEINDTKSLEYFGYIGESIKKLDKILEELAQVAFIKQGTIDLQSININSMLEEVIDTFKHYPQFETFKFKVNCENGNSFTSDLKLIKIALRNLIENSIKYRRTNMKENNVEITFSFNGQSLSIEVKDNGVGIPKEAQQDIFNMFVRANEASNGSGLGLYIVKNAIEKLKGTIEVESKEKIGSKFLINLPVVLN